MGKIQKLNIFTDGGARGNPGPAAVGVFIEDGKGFRIEGFGKTIGISTNNVAEYKAVIEALFWIIKNKEHLLKTVKINFFLDSNLVCSQITGLFRIKNSQLRDLFFQVRQLESEIDIPINYSYIPREKNRQADKYVNLALDRETKFP